MVCPECKGKRWFATIDGIEACVWCGARGHTWHPAQVQEARRLLCSAVVYMQHAIQAMHEDFSYGPTPPLYGFKAFEGSMRGAETECNRAAAVLGLEGKWWE